MADCLKPLPVDQVWGWYDRLAGAVASKGVEDWVGGNTVVVEALSAKLLRRWLKADAGIFNFEAPHYLQTYGKVLDVLELHRKMFLSEINPPPVASRRAAWSLESRAIRGSRGGTLSECST